ncbi:MAG: hypothetical protein Q8O89_03885, partial [Nanoarchaeota archaeon]|nr:hypothetical protein [Nanoarchaeota archaeon]
MKALNVFIKNLKILIRSRSSALIMLLGPLIVILLVGMSFNTSNKYELNVGVFVDEKNELTDSFITKMKQANLQVSDYTNKDFCVNDVKTGTINICLYFPRLAIENNATNEIVFFVDPSKVNLVTVVMNAVSSKVSERSEEITRDLTTVLTESLYVSQQEATSMKPLADSVYEDLKVSRAKVKDTLNRVEVLKLNYSMSSFKPQDFSDSSLKVNMSIENLRAAGYEAVEKGWELIAYTEEHMSGVPNSSEKNNIMIKMSLTKRDFDALNATLNRRSNFSDAGIGTLFALVSSLEDNLRSLDASLAEQGQAIEATKTQGTANLNDVYARTDRDVADMEKLKASIDKISSSVASVQVTNVGSISKPV